MSRFTKVFLTILVLIGILASLVSLTGCESATHKLPAATQNIRPTNTPATMEPIMTAAPAETDSDDSAAWENAGDPTTPYYWLESDSGSCSYNRFMYHAACYAVYSKYTTSSGLRYNDLMRNYYDLAGLWYVSGKIVHIEAEPTFTTMLVADSGDTDAIFVVYVADYVRLIEGDYITVYGEISQGYYQRNYVETKAPSIWAYDYLSSYDNGSIPLDILKEAGLYHNVDKVASTTPNMPDWLVDYWLGGVYCDADGTPHEFDGFLSVDGYDYTLHYYYVNPINGYLLLVVHFIDSPPEANSNFTYLTFHYNVMHSYTWNGNARVNAGVDPGTIDRSYRT